MLNRGAIETRRKREERGWSQRVLGREVKVAAPYICQLEKGIRKPGRAVSHRLQDVLSIDPMTWDQPVGEDAPTAPETPSHG